MLECRLALIGLLALAAPTVALAQADDAYEQAMARCDEAKQKGDFHAMAAAIRDALKFGPGTEYAWRSLSWALARDGEWQDALGVARENVDRNGESGWSLQQLAEAEMAAGEFAAAGETLAGIDELAEDAIGTAAGAIAESRKRLLDLIGQRHYRLHWEVDIDQGGPENPPARLLMPRFEDPHQTLVFKLSNVVSFERVSEGPRDFIDVVQKPGEPFQIDADVTIRGFALGHAALDATTSTKVPAELAGCLTPFHHGGGIFDPTSPLCSRVAGMCRSTTPARTVQNILDWMHANMVYADTDNRTVDDILAGGKGVCHHWCSSFTALCRAAGIPARVAHGVVLDGDGVFTGNQGSHGWASVYLDGLGWVPVDPLDNGSLALFGRSNYLLTDYANETPEDDHFAYTSIQGFKCDGEVLAIEPQPEP
jgi:hypothetical protein